MSLVQIQPGGLPIPAGTRVATDGTTLTGDGSSEHPLRTAGAAPGVFANVDLPDVDAPVLLAGKGIESVVWDAEGGQMLVTLTKAVASAATTILGLTMSASPFATPPISAFAHMTPDLTIASRKRSPSRSF